MSKMASALTGKEGERVALCDVSVSAVLQDLLAEVTISQTYRNDEQVGIEAVYTFPLPLDAVLLELEVEIRGKHLKGVVVEKKAAEETYEDAVAAGDAAVMLETIEPGLYTMNVGNLRPHETAKITFIYAILYRWAGDYLRFFLPTTIAPRFGESLHLPQQKPETSLMVENQFWLRIEIFGALRNAQFVCPSHKVELEQLQDKSVISLRQSRQVMDRDFILNVKAPQATRSFALCGPDGDGQAAVASFQPFFPGLHQPQPLNLAIVIDCSGSMHGDSMAQARQAISGILDGLQPHDRVTLIAFGDSTAVLCEQPLSCNTTNLAKAKRFAEALDANMGGTEIAQALREAYSVLNGYRSADIFLVTDGEVSVWQSVVDEARASGNRIFTVGVGSAVSEAFLRQLAAETGGDCELVSPREGMADRVVRHFERMRAPRAKRVDIRWPEGATRISPARIGPVFEGDTVVAFARFDQAPPNGSAILEVESESGEVMRQELVFQMANTPTSHAGDASIVARVAAAAAMKELGAGAGLAVALRYRLVSPWTNWLVVATRADADKAYDIPALRKVPQTMAAGWAGDRGVVAYCLGSVDLGMLASDSMSFEAMENLSFDEAEPVSRVPPLDLPEPYRRLIDLVNADASRLSFSGALDLLTESGLEAEFEDVLRHTAYLGLGVEAIAAILIARILGGPAGELLCVDAKTASASLQGHAMGATVLLKEMVRHGLGLARVNQELMARGILKTQDEDPPEKFERIRALLDHLDDASQRTAGRMREYRAALTGSPSPVGPFEG